MTAFDAKVRTRLLDALSTSRCVIVLGDTGCGKTTQLPQLLLDAGYNRVAVTQPRRVAAVAAARRVAHERRATLGGEVGYAIRFETSFGSGTRIKFVTDGVLLREAVADPQLRRYGALVLDEAHERSLNTDVLFALVKRLMTAQDGEPSSGGGKGSGIGPQRVIIASATMDAEHFSRYFWAAPIVRVSGHAHSVSIFHVAKPLTSDASRLEKALEVAMRLHTEWPPGPNRDLLLFLSGQEEIATAAHAARSLAAELRAADPSVPELLVLPLHASLPSVEQARVFAAPPDGVRKFVLATNIAETSLTIVGVRAVIDPGVVKEKTYDRDKGMEVLSLVPISQSAARQRAGRAGRTAPGEVWRLYSEEQLEHMQPTQLPEIHRTNLANAVLALKRMGIRHPLQLDWLDPPEPRALVQATRTLYLLGALDDEGGLTSLGHEMSQLPLEPRLSRTLLAARDLRCEGTAAALCAMLCVEDVFCRAGNAQVLEAAQTTRARCESEDGEQMTLLNVFEEWQDTPPHSRDDWCTAHGLQGRALRMADDVRAQLLEMLPTAPRVCSPDDSVGSGSDSGLRDVAAVRAASCGGGGRGDLGGSKDVRLRCRQAVCAGHFMNAARRVRGVSGCFMTLREPQQTVRNRGGAGAREVLTAEHVVFTELKWIGRLVMQHTCAVEYEWLVPSMARLQDINVSRLLGVLVEEGGPAVAPAAPAGGHSAHSAAKSAEPGNLAGRRNDEARVAAARERFEQRKRLRR